MLVHLLYYPSLSTLGNGIGIDNNIQIGIRLYTRSHGAIFNSLVSCWTRVSYGKGDTTYIKVRNCSMSTRRSIHARAFRKLPLSRRDHRASISCPRRRKASFSRLSSSSLACASRISARAEVSQIDAVAVALVRLRQVIRKGLRSTDSSSRDNAEGATCFDKFVNAGIELGEGIKSTREVEKIGRWKGIRS